MGRGGRGGGGGHSFSSGGSRGFSSHSSSSRSRGGYSGFSGGSSNFNSGYNSRGPMFYGGPVFFGGPIYHQPRNNLYYRAPMMSFNPLSFVFRTFRNIFWGILICIIIVTVASPGSSNSEITRSTVERTKLDSSMVNELDEYYSDNLGWIDSSYTLERGMKEFYSQTGVQPYLYLCDNLDGDYSGFYSEDTQEKFGNKLYEELFDDEGHILLVFCEYRSSEYVSFCVVGSAAKTVMDDEAREILLDYVDHYYYSDYEDDEFFSLAFEKAGSRIMTVEKSRGWIVAVAVIALIALIILFRQLEKRRDKKLEQMKAAQDILNTPLNEFNDDNVEDLAGKYEKDQ